mgnify:CR=1 FL=1
MYLVRRGLVDVIGDDGQTVVAVLGPGGYFGEVNKLLLYNELYKNSASWASRI